MKCYKCRYYQVEMNGVNDGYYTACKNILLLKQYKQAVMDEEIKNCKGYEEI